MVRTKKQRIDDVVRNAYARLNDDDCLNAIAIDNAAKVTAIDVVLETEAIREFGRTNGKESTLLASLFTLLEDKIR